MLPDIQRFLSFAPTALFFLATLFEFFNETEKAEAIFYLWEKHRKHTDDKTPSKLPSISNDPLHLFWIRVVAFFKFLYNSCRKNLVSYRKKSDIDQIEERITEKNLQEQIDIKAIQSHFDRGIKWLLATIAAQLSFVNDLLSPPKNDSCMCLPPESEIPRAAAALMSVIGVILIIGFSQRKVKRLAKQFNDALEWPTGDSKLDPAPRKDQTNTHPSASGDLQTEVSTQRRKDE